MYRLRVEGWGWGAGRPARGPSLAYPWDAEGRRLVYTETRELCYEAGDEVSKRLKTECLDLRPPWLQARGFPVSGL